MAPHSWPWEGTGNFQRLRLFLSPGKLGLIPLAKLHVHIHSDPCAVMSGRTTSVGATPLYNDD